MAETNAAGGTDKGSKENKQKKRQHQRSTICDRKHGNKGKARMKGKKAQKDRSEHHQSTRRSHVHMEKNTAAADYQHVMYVRRRLPPRK